jgi:hypothetical protein
MEEPNQVEPDEIPEQYRDPQIDELINQLRVLQSIANVLHDIREALYTSEYTMPVDALELRKEGYFVFPTRVSALDALRKAIEKVRPVSWYVRLVALFRVKHANSELRKAHAEQKKAEEVRREHMQRLAENAGKLNYGRFRGRYS